MGTSDIIQQQIVHDLKRIRTIGMARVELGSLRSLLNLLPENMNHGTGAYLMVGEMISDAIECMPTTVGLALKYLLGLDRTTQFASLERVRRPRAAAAVGYSASYLARYKEEEYLRSLAITLITSGSAQPHSPDAGISTRNDQVEALLERARNALSSASPDLAVIAMENGLDPVLRIASDDQYVRRNFSYRASLEAINLDDLMYSVESDYSSIRTFPDSIDDSKAVFCRTAASFADSFSDRNCVSAEFCNVDLRTWRRYFTDYCSSNVEIDNMPFTGTLQTINDEIAVFVFPRDVTVPGACEIHFRNTFLISGEARVFPIKLTNHFSMGTLNFEIRIIDSRITSLDAYTYLAGVQSHDLDLYGRESSTEQRWEPKASRQRKLGVRSRPDALIWPGSGVDFVWARNDPEHIKLSLQKARGAR